MMTVNENEKQTAIKLPDRLVSVVDLNRVFRELRSLDDWLNQATLRAAGQSVSAPKTSTTLEELAVANNISLLEPRQRVQLIDALAVFADRAPKIHMSFAVEPSAQFLNRMISWLRANINPVILLEVGLQPTLAAGCTVRTPNKLFDLSLRNHFIQNRHLLVDSIGETVIAQVPEPVNG